MGIIPIISTSAAFKGDVMANDNEVILPLLGPLPPLDPPNDAFFALSENRIGITCRYITN